MFEKLKTLREERGKIVKAMRDIIDAAQVAKRDMSDEEKAKHQELFGLQDKKRVEIEALERQVEAERTSAGAEGETREREGRLDIAPAGTPTRVMASPHYRSGFFKWMTGAQGDITPDERRALSAGVTSQGGFTIAPEQFVIDLIKFMDDNVLMRGLATKYTLPGAASIGVPSLDADPADSDWTSELAVGNEDTSMLFGKRKMVPNPLAKYIKVSNDLLRMSALPVEDLVRARLGYKFSITQEKAFLLGNGANQPLGVFTASSDGIATGRDISSGNTSTSIGFDGIINAAFAIKDQYRARAKWLFHRDAIKQIATLKDSQNRYLWQPSLQEGQPDRIFNIPVMSSEYAPNTFTTGLYVGLIGDFSFYWIVDSLDLAIQKLTELFALSNQTGFVGRAMTDGAPVLGEAFARVKLA